MVRYQVFLSFRGPETRDNLVQYLHDQLKRNGVEAFRDSEEIEDGQEISKTIEDAIESSDICVPVFSQDFASSAACLMEVAQMVKSGKEIQPIFFFVEPCDVHHQRGTYGKSFEKHSAKKYYPESTIKEWKDALKKIGGIKGLEFKKAGLKAALRADLKAALRAALEAALGAALEVALEAALEAALGAALEAALEVALKAALEGQTDVIQEPESKKAALEAALKAAFGEIGVIKRPEFKEAALEERGGTKGRFYNDLFSGFKKLEGFITRLVDLLRIDKKEETKNLVGVDRDVPQMVRKLGFDYQDGQVVRKQEMTGRMVLVVWGMPGVGKTSLAREAYNNIRHLFDGCSFLENVRHKNVESLQNKLIRDLRGRACLEVKYSEEGTKKIQHQFGEDRVLIVLDDVDNSDQIKPLAEKVTWFGRGSIIILTSRTRDMITPYKVPENSRHEGLCQREHEVLSMNENHALELFKKHAIELDDLPEDYDNLSRRITSAVGCLPFAIEIVGKYLRGRSNKIWKATLGKLKGKLDERVVQLFKENYDLLNDNTKEIFLDVACFFTRVKKRNPCYMWDAQQRLPDIGFDELQNISFLKIVGENELWMHNQLEIFGRETVKENRDYPGERSRLWDYEDVQTTLQETQVTNKVKALRVTPNPKQHSKVNCFHWKDFLHLPQLRFLDLDGADIKGNSKDVLRNLVWLDWHNCSEKSQLFALNMEKLVILDLSSSKVKLSLKDWGTLMKKAAHLKVLNAKDCRLIQAALEFPEQVPLECLILEGCFLKIPKDPRSTSGLKNLLTLNMRGCTQIEYLPQELCSLPKLEELFIDGTKIKRLEFEEHSLPLLEILSAGDCKDLVDVDSITFLKSLRKLILGSCKNLKKLPAVIGELNRLQEMDLSNTLIKELPLSVKKLTYLEVLKMVRTPLNGFPEAIEDLKKLKELDFTNCGSMVGDCNIAGLFSLRILKLKGTRMSLPRNIAEFGLHSLDCDHGDSEQTAS